VREALLLAPDLQRIIEQILARAATRRAPSDAAFAALEPVPEPVPEPVLALTLHLLTLQLTLVAASPVGRSVGRSPGGGPDARDGPPASWNGRATGSNVGHSSDAGWLAEPQRQRFVQAVTNGQSNGSFVTDADRAAFFEWLRGTEPSAAIPLDQDVAAASLESSPSPLPSPRPPTPLAHLVQLWRWYGAAPAAAVERSAASSSSSSSLPVPSVVVSPFPPLPLLHAEGLGWLLAESARLDPTQRCEGLLTGWSIDDAVREGRPCLPGASEIAVAEHLAAWRGAASSPGSPLSPMPPPLGSSSASLGSGKHQQRSAEVSG
jgi:hypothetical protein